MSKELPTDIKKWIRKNFKDRERVYGYLQELSTPETERVTRCILKLSDQDYDSVKAWVKNANKDYEEVICYGEYDNRALRKYNFNYSLYKQKEYSYGE